MFKIQCTLGYIDGLQNFSGSEHQLSKANAVGRVKRAMETHLSQPVR